ncbi:MAG: hypothetical protein FJY55_10805 [Betaproteobacteria bacterium]|nr:hypothetical protein [Betaproteobacteria bacterium]
MVHGYPDAHPIGLHFAPRLGIVCNTMALTAVLTPVQRPLGKPSWGPWLEKLGAEHQRTASWSTLSPQPEGVGFADVVRSLSRQAPRDAIVCVDAGSFAALDNPYLKYRDLESSEIDARFLGVA